LEGVFFAFDPALSALTIGFAQSVAERYFPPMGSQEASMTSVTRAELLDAASMKLAEVVLLLMEAGEKRLAREAGELAQQVEASAPTSQVTTSH
jgi:hypothetical protein